MLYLFRMFPGNRIRVVRLEAKLSQGELGSQVGLSQGQISNIENGDRNISLEWLRRIANALGCTVADLLENSDNPDRLTNEEATLLARFRSGDERDRDYILRTAAAVAERETRRTG